MTRTRRKSAIWGDPVPFHLVFGLLCLMLFVSGVAGFSVMTIGFGDLTLLDHGSSTAEWTIFQLIVSSALGLIISTSLPAVQAKLSDDDTAKSTGVWQFLRSFRLVFGSAIPRQCSTRVLMKTLG